jgi:hypothetical protein
MMHYLDEWKALSLVARAKKPVFRFAQDDKSCNGEDRDCLGIAARIAA